MTLPDGHFAETMREMEATYATAAAASMRPLHFGEAVVVHLQRVLKSAAFYSRTNPVFAGLVQEAVQTIRQTMSDGEADRLTLQVVRDVCFCNKHRIRVTSETLASYKALIALLRERRIGVLTFDASLTAADVGLFIVLFTGLPEGEAENARRLTEALALQGVTSIIVAGLEEGPEDPLQANQALKAQSKKVYFSTIGVIKELMQTATTAAEMDLRTAKRLMMSVVQLIMQDESSLLGLANIKSYDDYTFCHSVNVAIYAVALGQRIGLPKRHLYHLGISGLFHDIGKMSIPRSILNKPASLDATEWEVVRLHPERGAETVLHQSGWGELSARILTTAYEHHLKYDLSGYPRLREPRRLSLFSRIIALADCYDALGRPRVYRQTPYVSEKILAMMLAQSGRDFDPILVKAFINMIGVYPLGSLVLLNTNRIGVVVKVPENTAFADRPQVCLLSRRDDQYVKGEILDLLETAPETGEFRYSIQQTLDPNAYQFSIEEFFL